MKEKFVQFMRKHKIAFCLGLVSLIMVTISTVYLRDIISVNAEEPVVTLPEIPDEHPYVFVNEEYIEELLNLKDNEYYSEAYTWVSNKAKEKLPSQPENGYLSSSISRQLETRAFMYMLGEISEVDAQETVQFTIEYLKNAKTSQSGSINIYKDFGTQGIQTGALVYDWCYDIMTAKQRKELTTLIKNLMYADEQPCTPDSAASWYEVGGKAVGQPLIYNSIAAVAIYDTYPEIYEAVMPKILGSMAEAVKIYGEVGALSDGSIAYTRDYYAYHVAVLLERLGYEHEQYYGNQTNIGYKMLYSRTPYGALIKQGDDFTQSSYVIGQYTNRSETKDDMAMLSAIYNDPYLKFQYIKENTSESTLFALLFNSSEVIPELPDDLPLAFEVGEPRSEIMVRTSWQDGLDSPTVVAYMNMNNRRSGDHDHAHMGEFQLYYKGPLTMSAGRYTGEGWGKDHWENYYTRSISANCVTVYDPDEKFTYGETSQWTAEANDGGQKMTEYKFSLDKNMADANLVTETEASFIGPNEYTPAFSYIKGDLTNAYSSNKMESYKRAMVFMDTFNQDYPGVMVVFDRVVSTDASFKKNWLLQAVTEPVVDGNKITITNTDEGCNGKLVNTTLYPQNVEIETVGGIGTFISDGQEWPIEYDEKMSDAYISGFRCEVSPTTAATEDIFLNAMYVTDANGNVADLPMISVTSNVFMGVATLDRQVMFSKNGEKVGTAFSVEVIDNGYEEVICLMTDVAAGNWTVSGNGTTVILEAAEAEGCLVFTAQPGTYTITPAGADAEATEMTWEEVEKEKIGDFTVKIGSIYAYVKNPNRLVEGQPYIAIADILERYLGAVTETNGKTLTVTLKDGRIFTFNAGSKEYTINSGNSSKTGELGYEPFLDANGVFYMNCDGVSSRLGFNAAYTAKAKTLKMVIYPSDTQIEGDDSSNVLWPVAITASTSSGGYVPDNLIDRNLDGASRWSSIVADGEWVCFDLGAEMEISSLQIAFYNGAKRNWVFDIQISNDGETFTTVDGMKGLRSSGTTADLETFTLPEGTKARYVRYVGHGVYNSETSAWMGYYNSVTEFIINEKVVSNDPSKVLWPVAITASTSSGGYVPDNLIDRNLDGASRWSSIVADGEWVCFDLGAEMEISSLQIAFYNGAKRNWVFDIQISNDGKNFTTVEGMEGLRSSGTSVNLETFTLPEGTKARYVRYVGHGVYNSETSAWIGYYNSITEFIINE
ncbi:MAG: discoidin domain-containing protein [Lachnospiraceae bacterium]|nr:discoidin domain-containing protein [Lachnospiraceae bacterium]